MNLLPVMRSVFSRWASMVLLALFSSLGWAEVPVPQLTAQVVDTTGRLSSNQRAALMEKLQALEARKGSQIAVLLVHTTQPETIEQYALRVAEAWKIGRARVDDGAILVLALQDRTLRIEVGYGLEGVLTDIATKRIIEDFIIPQLRQDNLAGAIHAGVDQMIRLIEGEPLPAPATTTEQGSQGRLAEIAPLLFMLALMLGGGLRRAIGKLPAALTTGGLVFLAGWFFTGAVLIALLAALAATLLTLAGVRMGGLGSGRGGVRRPRWRWVWWVQWRRRRLWRRWRFRTVVTMQMKRLFRHLMITERHVRQVFTRNHLQQIAQTIKASEKFHSGEIRFAVESSLEFQPLLRGQTPRQRALEVFSRLRVWDTEHNNGVLIYILLADRAIEIVADRGIHARVGTSCWEQLCREIQVSFSNSQYGEGATVCIQTVSQLLIQHFPDDGGGHNELPDLPIIIG